MPHTGCRCNACHHGNPHQPADTAAIERALTHAGHPKPVRLRVVTMPSPRPQHDPATCARMICDEPECLAANGQRPPQGNGNANTFRRAAA